MWAPFLHGAYRTALKETDWELEKTLKAAHGIFKKSPARRAGYLSANGHEERYDDKSLCAFFPLKFCGHRWLENGKAITRFLEIIDKLATFMTNLKESKRFPKNDERFPLLLCNTKSKIFPAYCEFSLSICRDIEPFLALFQAERPLAMFLYQKLRELILSLMERFVKSNVLNANGSVYKLLTLDLKSEENLILLDSINIGFGATCVLRKLSTTEKTLERSFRKGARAALIHLILKLFEKCPLKFKMTRAISCLSSTEISSLKPEILKKRFNLLVQLFHDDRIISSIAAEKAEKRYNQLINNSDFLEETSKFNINHDRVDEFYSRILDSSVTLDLENVVRLVLILSYGNARVESGFSINNDILSENMLEESIVSQRIVYEGVHKAGSAEDVEITPEMLKAVKASHRTYKAAHEEKQKRQSAGQKRQLMKRKVTLELKNAVAKKKAAVDDLKSKITQFDPEIHSLQEQLKK